MTFNEMVAVAGYLANPIRITTIEVEIREESLTNYISAYEAATIDISFPLTRTGYPVQVIPIGGDKWGREMRVYFNSADPNNIPPELEDLSTVSNRPGYEQYNKRVNNNNLIDQLIEFGFALGSNQSENRIRSRISRRYISEFNSGYNLR